MTVTYKLREMLDERGVEWHKTPHYSSKSLDNETIFAGNGIEWYAREDDGYVELRTAKLLVTPSQAVAATVGDVTDFYVCETCGVAYGLDFIDKGFAKSRYCPHCGQRRAYS